MVWPSTNCAPISRIARLAAVRITGSPRRRTAPRSTPATPSPSRSTRPVSISPQVEAFTSGEEEWPRCAPHREGAILSSISASMVAASGTLRSASAKHISATPSSVESPYSARNASISPGRPRPRMARTRPTALAPARSRVAASGAWGRSASSTAPSGARWASRIASRPASSVGVGVDGTGMVVSSLDMGGGLLSRRGPRGLRA